MWIAAHARVPRARTRTFPRFHACTCAWPRRACTATLIRGVYLRSTFVCACVSMYVCARARYTAVSCTLEHGNAAPPRGTRDGRSGDTESEPQAGLRASPLPLARHTLIRSHSLPFVSVAPKPSPSLLLHPRTPSSYYHLLRHLHRGSIHDSHHRRRSSPLWISLPPSLSLFLSTVRFFSRFYVQRGRSFSPPRCIPGGYARGARTDLSNPHGLPWCATFVTRLCEGRRGVYVRVGAHNYERGEIFRLCPDRAIAFPENGITHDRTLAAPSGCWISAAAAARSRISSRSVSSSEPS